MKAALIIGTVALVVHADFAPNIAHLVANSTLTDADGNVLNDGPVIKFVSDDWVVAPSAGLAVPDSEPKAAAEDVSVPMGAENDVAAAVEDAAPAAGYPRIE